MMKIVVYDGEGGKGKISREKRYDIRVATVILSEIQNDGRAKSRVIHITV